MTERIVHGMSEADYHNTCALSAGGAWMLANECPAIYWHFSPFNPAAAKSKNGKPMDIGTAVHLAALEPDRFNERVVLVEAEDWRTKDARDARDAAYAAGLVPLLPKDDNLVGRLAVALRANQHAAALLAGAATEVSYFWEADGIPFKARADVIARSGAIADLKASASASPLFFARQAFSTGHFLRAPWYLDGLNLLGHGGDKPYLDYWFVVVAREEPHLITVCRLDDRAIEWGRLMIRRSIDLFKRCRDRGEWPAYCDGPITLSLPEWAEFRLADREQAGDFRLTTAPDKPMPADVRRGFDFLAP